MRYYDRANEFQRALVRRGCPKRRRGLISFNSVETLAGAFPTVSQARSNERASVIVARQYSPCSYAIYIYTYKNYVYSKILFFPYLYSLSLVQSSSSRRNLERARDYKFRVNVPAPDIYRSSVRGTIRYGRPSIEIAPDNQISVIDGSYAYKRSRRSPHELP